MRRWGSVGVYRFVVWLTIISLIPGSVGAQNLSSSTSAASTEEHTLPSHLKVVSELRLAQALSALTTPLGAKPDDNEKLAETATSGTASKPATAHIAQAPVAATPSLPEPFSPTVKGLKPDVSIDLPAELDFSDEPMRLAQASQPQGAIDLLEDAAQYEAAGDFVQAALTYLEVLDQYPRTVSSKTAYGKLDEFSQNAIAGILPPSDLQAFQAALPSWEQCNSAESRYILIGFAYTRAAAAKAAGDAALQEQANRWLLLRAEDFITSYPNHPLNAYVLRHIFQAAVELTPEDQRVVFQRLRRAVRESGNGALKWMARAMLAEYLQSIGHSRGDAMSERIAMVTEHNAAAITDIVNDPSVYDAAKAWFLYYAGNARATTGDLDGALSYFQAILENFPRAGAAGEMAAFQSARTIDTKFPDDPYQAVLAYQAVVDDFPESRFAALALLRMARLYVQAEDYAYARQVYQEILDGYSGTRAAEVAVKGIEYLEDHLETPINEYEAVKLQRRALQMAQNCGPVALQQLLARMGRSASVRNLSLLAGTDESGTSLLGLLESSLDRGVPLFALEVEAGTLPEPPFIAFVDENHYVLVTETSDESVSFVDGYQPETTVTHADFSEMWSGIALSPEREIAIAALLDHDVLHTVRGGSGGTPGCCTNPPPPCSDCSVDNEGDALAGQGDGNVGDTQVHWHRDSHQERLEELQTIGDLRTHRFALGRGPDEQSPRVYGPGAPLGDLAYSGRKIQTDIATSGVHALVDALTFAQVFHETDLVLKSVGDLHLEFSRTFANPYGLSRGDFVGVHPHKNNIGANWTHSLNMHIRYTNTSEQVLLYDERGNGAVIDRTSYEGGKQW